MNELEDRALKLLKLDLGISHTKRDELLNAELKASERMLYDRGISLDLSVFADMLLLVMHSAWLHERKDKPELSMPRSLALMIRNRQARESFKGGSCPN